MTACGENRYLSEVAYPTGEESRIVIAPSDNPRAARAVAEFLVTLTEVEIEQLTVLAHQRYMDLRGYHRECSRKGILPV